MAEPGRAGRTAPAAVLWSLSVLVILVGGVACTGSDDGSTAGSQTTARPDTAPDGTTAGDDLVAELRAGGVVIVIRHAATDQSQPDDDEVDLDDCSTQRNLTAAGRTDAKTIGAAFRALQIPVGTVWASPYCRSRDTARLAFGRAEVVEGLERLYPVPDEVAQARLNTLLREQAPAPGEPNLVIAGHGVYPSVLAPAVAIEEGEAALYAVREDGFVLVGRVAPHEWAELDSSRSPSEGAGEAARQLATDVLPGVVSVQPPGNAPAGSGFRVAIPGIVVTAAHVVADASEVDIVLPDGQRRAARVLGRAADYDIAVLEVDDTGLPPLHSHTGLDDARLGDPVLAIGSPHSGANTLAAGPLRALNASVRLGTDAGDLDALRSDGSITPASSGGPLVNARGDVLGLLTTLAIPRVARHALGTTFAIPVDVAQQQVFTILRRASSE